MKKGKKKKNENKDKKTCYLSASVFDIDINIK